MQVGMVSTFLCRCGIATYSNFLSEALIKDKVDVTVLAEYPFPNDSALDKDLHTNVPYFYCWKRTEFYDRLIKESQNYDICHIQHQYGLFNNTYAWIELLKRIEIPKVVTVHDIVLPSEAMSTYFNETFARAKKLIVHTNACYQVLLRWNCPQKKIELIPHGTKLIDVPTKVDARRQLQLPEDSEIILSWGFIWESKGILDLVKIFAEILKSHPNAIFIHAGGVHPIIQVSDYLRNILKSAISLGLSPKNFIITDWVPEDKVPLYFGASDVIVLNYMRGSASASGAAHRALGSQRPVVKTDDLCLEDIPGYAVPRFDNDRLRDAIIKVLEDKNLQNELVSQAAKAAQETSWQRVAKMHKILYEKIL